MIIADPDGAVELYYDGTKALQTQTQGIITWSNSADVTSLYMKDSAGDIKLLINTDSGNTYINSESGSNLQLRNGTEKLFYGQANGPVFLYYDNSQALYTVEGGIYLLNGSGAGLQLKTDGSDSTIYSYIHGGTITVYGEKTATGTQAMMAVFDPDGAAELYYAGSKKFETTSSGVKVNDTLEIIGDIYCNDIHTASGTVYIGTLKLSTDGIDLVINDGTGGVSGASGGESAPIASIIATADDTAPTGYIACEGAAISRTTYVGLYNKIGVRYGNGDGSTTFNVPDYRGYIFRAWDHGAGRDPDRASRTDRGDGTTGDNVGTFQADAYKSHTHTQDRPSSRTIYQGNGGQYAYYTYSNANTGSSGGNETRPININVLYCIKY
jgi:microcystin-dependent protein